MSELRQRHLVDGRPVPRAVLTALEADPRPAARSLLRALRSRAAGKRKERLRLRRMLAFEAALWKQGFQHVAGVDEAGMGPCAGPVCAGAAILPQGYTLDGLDDSKKIPDESLREALAAAVQRDAVAWAVGWASVEEIDSLNIYHAGLLAMRRAVEGLTVSPHYLLVDARTVPGVGCPQQGIVRGDAQSLCIAAGAILAKSTRDRLLGDYDRRWPGYGFARHKGYPTPEHLEALQHRGVLEVHRKTWAPVRRALGLEPVQDELFGVMAAAGEVEPARR